MENNTSNPLSIPIAIIIAGLIIGGAVYFEGGTKTPANPQPAAAGAAGGDEAAASLENLAPITANDHVRGPADAPITIVEFSDLECPFCKSFHQTMQQVMQEYSGQVRWVYRHFPLDSLHAKARPEALATECAAEVGGNDGFWALTDKIFEVTSSNDGLDLNSLPDLGTQVGLERAAFEECLKGGRHADVVQAHYDNAVAIGGRGTPFPIVIGPTGQRMALQGAVPIEGMRQLLDTLLAESD